MPGRNHAHLLEREQELSELGAALDGARTGQGQLLIVEGAAGAGKSALLGAARERAAAGGLRVLSARGTELESAFAFGAIRQLFEPVLVAAPKRERERLLAGAAGPAERIIALDVEPSQGGPEPGFTALHSLYWLAANIAAATPLALLVDDAHWLDSSSLRSLNYLAGRIADIPIVLLTALRPQEPGAPVELLDGLRAQPGAAQMTLGALAPESVADIVHEQVPDADAALCAACHAASRGNPLYLKELLRTLRAGNGASVDAVRDASIPSLADGVARRIARVAPEAPALSSAMAVLDDGGRLAVAAAMTGLGENEAARIARRLRGMEVLTADDPFAFVHPLVRRSVYDRLSVSERDAAHTAAAGLLREAGASAEAIAAHLGAVRPARSGAVAATLVDAADQALAHAAPDAAIDWLHRALEEGAPEPPRALILAQLGLAEVASRDMDAVGHLREALELADDPALRARVSVALAEILFNAGLWESGVEVVDAAVDELCEAPPDIAVEVEMMRAIVTIYDSRRAVELDRRRERFEVLATGNTWAAHALSAVLAAAAALRGDRIEQVVPLVEQALRGGRLLAERGAGAGASAQALYALWAIDEHDRALAACDELAARARGCGSLTGSYTALGIRAAVFARRGELAAAEAEVRTALDVVVQAGMPMMMTTAVHSIQDAILERPGLEDVAALVESTELDPAFLGTWGGAMLLDVRGRLRLLKGDRVRAIEDLRAFARTAAKLHVGPTLSSWRSTLALALPRQEREAAMELVAEELELARATGLPRPYGVALRAAGILAGGESGIEELRESVSVLESSEARLEHARSLVELGGALRRGNRRGEARELLSAGMELAHRSGAQRLVARAHEELQAAGARPRRIASTGVDALTASELRVVRLAADGATNPEIAQELYVTVKTVETHLSHAYSKLGLSGQGSRGRLAQALEAVRPSGAAEP